jgi:hypothetical protein
MLQPFGLTEEGVGLCRGGRGEGGARGEQRRGRGNGSGCGNLVFCESGDRLLGEMVPLLRCDLWEGIRIL